jgi:hypothetical protein
MPVQRSRDATAVSERRNRPTQQLMTREQQSMPPNQLLVTADDIRRAGVACRQHGID